MNGQERHAEQNRLSPESEKKLMKKSKNSTGKHKKLRVFLIVFGILLAAVIGFMLWRQVGLFSPKCPVKPVGASQIDAGAPDEKEQQQMDAYVGKLEKKYQRRMSKTQKKDIEEFLDILGQYSAGADIGTLLDTMGVTLPEEILEREMKAPDEVSVRHLAAYPDTDSSKIRAVSTEESEGADSGMSLLDALSALADELASEDGTDSFTYPGETLPSQPIHGALGVITAEKEQKRCPVCGTMNPKDASVCIQCGTSLEPSPYTVTLDPEITPDSSAVTAAGEQSTASVLNGVANQMMFAGETDMAFYLTCLAAEAEPHNASVLCTLTTLLRASDELKEAKGVADYALRWDPANEPLLYSAGLIAVRQNDPDEAEKYFNRALAAADGSGPANQGLMFVALARQDFPSAFLYMLEGARDGYTSAITFVYENLRVRPDFIEIEEKVFSQYTMNELMDFKRNRSAFDPTLDTVGQQIRLDDFTLPLRAVDLFASGGYMVNRVMDYVRDATKFMLVDNRETLQKAKGILGTLSGILGKDGSEKKSVFDLFSAFSAKTPEKTETEAERMISYEQETFWLDMLEDYLEYEIRKIDKERDAGMEKIEGLEDVLGTEASEYMEQIANSAENDPMASLNLMTNIMDNQSAMALTPDQSQTAVSKIDSVLEKLAKVQNTAYDQTRMSLEEYWFHANAILGLIADDTTYNLYRHTQILNIIKYQVPYLAYSGVLGFSTVFLEQPYRAFIGGEAATRVGNPSAEVPAFPKLPISGKGATPTALMYGDILVPNVPAVTKEVLGLTAEELEENARIAALQSQNERLEAFWNSLTPQERVQFTAFAADPSVVHRRIMLNPYPGSGETVVEFYEEPITEGSVEFSDPNASNLTGVKPEESVLGNTTVSFTDSGKLNSVGTKIGVGSIMLDRNGNMTVMVKDRVGIAVNARDITTFVRAKAGLDTTVLGVNAVDVSAQAQIYSTYNCAEGRFTSGGIKGGLNGTIAGRVGAVAEVDMNAVTGLGTGDISALLLNRKIGVHIASDFSLWSILPFKSKDEVPGVQEYGAKKYK